MKGKISRKRRLLEKLVSIENTKLSEGRILEVSRQLDKLIVEYYRVGNLQY